MDANKRAEEFFADMILTEDSEIRKGCIYLIARVIHDGMQYQKMLDAEIAKKHGSTPIAKAIEDQVTEVPEPSSFWYKMLVKLWRK